MGKKYLFSPIGNTDPIKYLYDGSMLHICRYYEPDVVYLYLSKEMAENHKKDNFFIKFWHLSPGNDFFSSWHLIYPDAVFTFIDIMRNFLNQFIVSLFCQHYFKRRFLHPYSITRIWWRNYLNISSNEK